MNRRGTKGAKARKELTFEPLIGNQPDAIEAQIIDVFVPVRLFIRLRHLCASVKSVGFRPGFDALFFH
jgi:hypothetical protein